jgi:succinate-semialdehyde dehydrogenase / glutarate-semialdehyde dehydrogenase
LKYNIQQVDDAIQFLKNFPKEYKTADNFNYSSKGTILIVLPKNEPIIITTIVAITAAYCKNKVLIKPGSLNTSNKLIQIFNKNGVVIEALNLSREDLRNKIKKPGIDTIFWMGSSKVGNTLGSIAIKTGKEFIKESEGNDWCIVSSDFKIKTAAKLISEGYTHNNGEMCNSIRGVFVEEPSYNELVKELDVLRKKLHVGDPMKINTDIGPMTSDKITLVVKKYLKRNKYLGEQIKGNIIPPTLILNPKDDDPIICNELFAPVIWIKSVKKIEDVLSFYNKNQHGLCATILCKNRIRALKLGKQISVATIFINKSPIHVNPYMPWGGIKKSGFGGPQKWFLKFLNKKRVHG